MRIVDDSVCKVGCQEHEHVGPVFTPQPDLDEIGVGWTTQHVPRDRTRHIVPKKCIFCWGDLADHSCKVLEVIRG